MDALQLEKVIINAKRKYNSVFATTIGDEVYIWRLLTKGEYEIILKSTAHDKMLKEELICQTVVLYPDVDFTTYNAGVPTKLAPQILEESGFGSANKTYSYLANTRQKILQDFSSQAEIVIAAAFPQYTFEEMREWNIEKLLDMVARAEWKLNVIDGKDFVFTASDDEETTEEVVEKTEEELILEEKNRIKEMEKAIIESGGDPILELGEYYKSKVKKPYMDYPYIMGKNWDREDVLNAIGQQLRKSNADN